MRITKRQLQRIIREQLLIDQSTDADDLIKSFTGTGGTGGGQWAASTGHGAPGEPAISWGSATGREKYQNLSSADRARVDKAWNERDSSTDKTSNLTDEPSKYTPLGSKKETNIPPKMSQLFYSDEPGEGMFQSRDAYDKFKTDQTSKKDPTAPLGDKTPGPGSPKGLDLPWEKEAPPSAAPPPPPKPKPADQLDIDVEEIKPGTPLVKDQPVGQELPKSVTEATLIRIIRQEILREHPELLEEGIFSGALKGLFRSIPGLGNIAADAHTSSVIDGLDDKLTKMDQRIGRLEQFLTRR